MKTKIVSGRESEPFAKGRVDGTAVRFARCTTTTTTRRAFALRGSILLRRRRVMVEHGRGVATGDRIMGAPGRPGPSPRQPRNGRRRRRRRSAVVLSACQNSGAERVSRRPSRCRRAAGRYNPTGTTVRRSLAARVRQIAPPPPCPEDFVPRFADRFSPPTTTPLAAETTREIASLWGRTRAYNVPLWNPAFR